MFVIESQFVKYSEIYQAALLILPLHRIGQLHRDLKESKIKINIIKSDT